MPGGGMYHGVMWSQQRECVALKEWSKLQGNDVEYGANWELSMTELQPTPQNIAAPAPHAGDVAQQALSNSSDGSNDPYHGKSHL